MSHEGRGLPRGGLARGALRSRSPRTAQVHPGDALRFAYESPEAGHLLVLELDGRGAASVFHPFGWHRSAPLPAAQRDFLPGSVVLDDAAGAGVAPRRLLPASARGGSPARASCATRPDAPSPPSPATDAA